MYRGIGENTYKIKVVLVPSFPEDTYNEYDENRNFKYTYFSNPDTTYFFSFTDAGINMDNVNVNNGEQELLPDGTPNPAYRRSIVEYMQDTYGIYPTNGYTAWNTDVTMVEPDGFEGKYVYNTFRYYIKVTPGMFPLRVVMASETTLETNYTEMVCVAEENGTYT
mgnify:CR=1 FL=1